MAIDYAVLRTEMETDPNGYGYAPLLAAGADQALADMLNEVRASIDIKRADISSGEVFHAIALGDLKSNPNSFEAQWWGALLNRSDAIRLVNEDGTATPVRANVLQVVTGSTSRTRLAALETRKGSRAEQLFGAGTSVRHEDVMKARVA